MTLDLAGLCWHCGHQLSSVDYGRETTCQGCGKDTRTCRNCRHYATARPNECLEPMAERVLVKDRANFCEFFEPSDRPSESGSGGTSQEALRAAADALFRK